VRDRRPQTIDNDLPHTDHCPGYGSVIKYAATTVMEIAADVGSMATEAGSCCIIEVMGRRAGWIAAGTVLAKRAAHEAPHLILTPEIPFDQESFLKRVRESVDAFRCCVVVVGEGLKDRSGQEIAADPTRRDALWSSCFFRHRRTAGGSGQRKNSRSKAAASSWATRSAPPRTLPAPPTPREAVACGEAAVRAAAEGKSGYMVKLVRLPERTLQVDHRPATLADIANVEHQCAARLDERRRFPAERKVHRICPAADSRRSQVPVEGGLPKYVVLDRSPVEKKLGPRPSP